MPLFISKYKVALLKRLMYSVFFGQIKETNEYVMNRNSSEILFFFRCSICLNQGCPYGYPIAVREEQDRTKIFTRKSAVG